MNTVLPSHAIRGRFFYYGPSEKIGFVDVGTLEECRQRVKEIEANVYHLSHNESGRPIYTIVTTDSLSPHARLQAEQVVNNTY